ncbi:hypothetical protein [Abyssalbus ytuae]|uniref:Uncharacterized protein n=1 Tax=Abyssalbus ytuae TaxID=2926907 RepID=A0A9E7D3K6_9FLAO|nr:hypothetical protein [Abyssalbus ytuae]UOB19418.1 hypothetical protein MQE35_08990 [Abyssalbus ytuae]
MFVSFLRKITGAIRANYSLLKYILLSYFDKTIIFLIPLLVLYLFNNKSLYVSVEYIYSFVLVIVPFLDFGLSGYFFYYYREHKNKKAAILAVFNLFTLLYITLFLFGIMIILIHYLWFSFEKYILYIVFRCLFLVLFMFLSSYHRLMNKPKKALFITITSNIISLIVIFYLYIFNLEISVFPVFVGQILFCCYFFLVLVRKILKTKTFKKNLLKSVFFGSVLFAWPTIIQVFLMMYIANYGKIKAINHLNLEEATLLSLTQRYSMLIQLTHTSIVAFLMKDLYLENMKKINLKRFFKYFLFLLLSVVGVVILICLNWYHKEILISRLRVFQVSILMIGYTILWCIYSFLEIFYSRENKNIIKLYLAIVNAIVFIIVINGFSMSLLDRIVYAMMSSVFIALICSIIVLKQRGYYLYK